MLRYVLIGVDESEVAAYKEYLFGALHLWFIETPGNTTYRQLLSFPFSGAEYVFVRGHNYMVSQYLKAHQYENQVATVVISCTPKLILSEVPTLRNVFFCRTDSSGYAPTRYGEAFGFSFEITDSELDFYNNKGLPLDIQISKSFEKVR